MDEQKQIRVHNTHTKTAMEIGNPDGGATRHRSLLLQQPPSSGNHWPLEERLLEALAYLLDGAGIGHPAEKRLLPGPQQDSGGNRVTSAATGVLGGPDWECKLWDQRVQNMGPKSAKYGTRECKIWDQTFSLKLGWYTFSWLGVQNMGPKSAKYGTKECKIWDQRVQNMGLTLPT